MADKAKPQGLSRRRVTEPEGLARRRATEDDVEGHGFKHASDGISAKRIVEPDGLSQRRATEDDDVEGHSLLLNPTAARDLARARERDVQKSTKMHKFEVDARDAKKGR
jgi:hypothetical protein